MIHKGFIHLARRNFFSTAVDDLLETAGKIDVFVGARSISRLSAITPPGSTLSKRVPRDD
jgi:hypothetical protein